MTLYDIGDPVGRGGMADVNLALQEGAGGLQRLVVIKRIAQWARGDHDYVQSFLRESRIAASANHPNIVTTLDLGEDEDGPFIVMEYLSGETLAFVLRTLTRRKQRLPVPMVCRIALSVASALHFIHGLTRPDGTPWRVIHRDVSPTNIMVSYGGHVKLLDFGVAKIAHEQATNAGTFKGKPAYTAPEQLTGEPLDRRTDIFQLGVVCWEMLTGVQLFSSNPVEAAQQIGFDEIRSPRELVPEVPGELEELVMWALRRERRDRCPSAQAFAERLERFAPDLFGTSSQQAMATFMTCTFPERLAERMRVEQGARTAATRRDPRVSITPSVAPRRVDLPPNPIVSSSSLAMPPALAPAIPPATRSPSSTQAFLVALGVTATLMALVVVGLAMLMVRSGGADPEPGAETVHVGDGGLEPIPAPPDPEIEARPADADLGSPRPTPGTPGPRPPHPPHPAHPSATTPVSPPAGGEPLPLEPPASEAPPAPEGPPASEEVPPAGDEPPPDSEEEAPPIDIITDNLDPWGTP